MSLITALRALRAHSLFNTLIVALLALGIGASTAIFSVVNGVLLKPLPYPNPGELVTVRKLPRESGAAIPGGGDLVPGPEFLAWLEARPKMFRALAGYQNETSTYVDRGEPARVSVAAVTSEFFALLGVTPWRGRFFNDADVRPGAPLTVVLTHSAWQARFGGDENVLGGVVKFDEVPHTVIGILPPQFAFTDPVQFWRPLQLVPTNGGEMRLQLTRVFGRLAPDITAVPAQAELAEISRRYWENFAQGMSRMMAMAGFGQNPATARQGIFSEAQIQLVPLQEMLVRESRATLWLLLTAMLFVLLIACANVANLQLTRAAGRRRDLALRAALGGSPRRLALEALTENLLLAAGGGVGGAALAWAGTRATQLWLATYLPHINPISIDLSVLGFAVGLTLLAGLCFGLAPAIQALRTNVLLALKEGSPQHSSAHTFGRQALVSIEVALALVLAVNTGLLVKSINRLYATELGFRTEETVAVNLSLPPARYRTPAQIASFAERWLAAVAALPGVKSAALIDAIPLTPMRQMTIGATPGAANDNAGLTSAPRVQAIASVSPGYFGAAGIAVRQGRNFDDRDSAGALPVAIVNEEYVRRYFPDGVKLNTSVVVQPPPGPGLPPRGSGPPTAVIVAVVANVRPGGFEAAPQPTSYFPLLQQPRQNLSTIIYASGEAADLRRSLVVALQKIDSDLAPDAPQTMEQLISRQNAPRKIALRLTSAFAMVAVLLAALGIFSVMSYTVTQRTREIGVRMALGASGDVILRWIMGHAFVAVGAGLALGIALTFATGRLLKTFLTGLVALDPAVLALGIAGLGFVGLIACLMPALRATRVSPVVALRSE